MSQKILRFILCFRASWAFLVFTKMLTFWVIFMTGECGNIGTPPARLVLGPFNQYQVTQIDQISLPPYCKTCFSTSGWFWHAKKNLANRQKKWVWVRPPPPVWEKFPRNAVFFLKTSLRWHGLTDTWVDGGEANVPGEEVDLGGCGHVALLPATWPLHPPKTSQAWVDDRFNQQLVPACVWDCYFFGWGQTGPDISFHKKLSQKVFIT